MNFFKSSVFSDFKLPDVLAFNEKDTPFSSRDSETSITFESGEISSDLKSVADYGSGPPSDSGSASDAGVSKQEDENTGLWGFGGLVKSITSKSEGILQAYRKDLEEFGSGLKKETQILAEVAAHAVKDLPTSLETSANIAQESIETVGQVVEDFSSSVLRGIAELSVQGKDAVLNMDDEEGSDVAVAGSSRYDNVVVGKYSRFEAQVRAMQHDSGTYCEEPADIADYAVWKSTFSLSDKREDIDSIVAENIFFQELLSRFVPEVVSEDIFWTRYFYHFHKLQQTEEARADLVKRAIALDEEDLTWDTEEEADEVAAVHEDQTTREDSGNSQENFMPPLPVELPPVDSSDQSGEIEVADKSVCLSLEDDLGSKDPARSTLEDEDELGWEVAEDVESSSNDGKRSSNSETSWEVAEVPREEIRKRFATQEQDEEDLSWDVDDGDDGTK